MEQISPLSPRGTLARLLPRVYAKAIGEASLVSRISLARTGSGVPLPKKLARDPFEGLSLGDRDPQIERRRHMGVKGHGSIIMESMTRFPEVREHVTKIMHNLAADAPVDLDQDKVVIRFLNGLSRLEPTPNGIKLGEHAKSLLELWGGGDPSVKERVRIVASGLGSFVDWLDKNPNLYHFGKRIYGKQLCLERTDDQVEVANFEVERRGKLIRVNDIHIDDFVLRLAVDIDDLSPSQRKKLDDLRQARRGGRVTGASIYNIQEAIALDPELQDIVEEAIIFEFKLGDRKDYAKGKQRRHREQASRYLFHAYHSLRQLVGGENQGKSMTHLSHGQATKRQLSLDLLPSIKQWPEVTKSTLAYFGRETEVIDLDLEKIPPISSNEVLHQQLITAAGRILNAEDTQEFLRMMEGDDNGLRDILLRRVLKGETLLTSDIYHAVIYSGLWIPFRDGSIIVNLNDLDLTELQQFSDKFNLPDELHFHEEIKIRRNNLSLAISAERHGRNAQAVAYLLCDEGLERRILHRFEVRDPEGKPVNLKLIHYDLNNVMPIKKSDGLPIPFLTGRFSPEEVETWLGRLIERFKMNTELSFNQSVRLARQYLKRRNIDFNWAVERGLLLIRGTKDLHDLGLLGNKTRKSHYFRELRIALGLSKGSTFREARLLKGRPRLAFAVIDIDLLLDRKASKIVGLSTREIPELSEEVGDRKSALPSHMAYMLADAVGEHVQYKYVYGDPTNARHVFLVEGIFDYLSIGKLLEDAGFANEDVCIVGNVGLHGLHFLKKLRNARSGEDLTIIDGFDRYRDERRDRVLRKHRNEGVLKGTTLFWDIAEEILSELGVEIPNPEKAKDLNDLHGFLLESGIYDEFVGGLRKRFSRPSHQLEIGHLREKVDEP